MTVKLDLSIVEADTTKLVERLEAIKQMILEGTTQENQTYFDHQTLDKCSFDMKLRPVH
ncbi:MAG TPA: hypothetical protein VM577_03055 [Anaerovoracaceae bacterium]|nr:hypothetical protein [Anaerovoracaceae bacterium]